MTDGKRKKKVMLVEGSGRGFLTHYAHALAMGLGEGNIDVLLVTGQRDEMAGWEVPFRKTVCRFKGWFFWFYLIARVRDFRPDVVHIQWVNRPLAAYLFVQWLKKIGIGTVYTPHNLLPHRGWWLTLPVFRALYGAVDRIVARDSHIAWGIEDILGIHNNRSVYIPGSPNLMAHPTAPRRPVSGLAGRRKEELRLLFFGHGSARKGLEELLRALSARPCNKRVHLVIAGEGVIEKLSWKVLADARERLCITLLDRYIDPAEVPVLFSQSDLLLMPYVKQCKSPLTDLAAAFSLPVLRSCRVDAARFIEGLHGVTFEGENADAFTETLTGLVEDPPRIASMREAMTREESVSVAINRLAESHEHMYSDIKKSPIASPIAGLKIIEESTANRG